MSASRWTPSPVCRQIHRRVSAPFSGAGYTPFFISTYSRMVTGMYVGLEGPSWAGAMMAIENAASDKVAYCSSYGVTITEDEWPCHHIPTAILGDRGEMESKLADNLVQMLGIRIENAPPYRADLKGIIEQHFRTININALPFLPGKVLPDMSERGGRDYRLDAKLDIRQFTEIIIRCVLYYNNSHCMDYFEKSEQMMQVGVDAVPLELWNFGIRYCSGCLRTGPKDTLRLALMHADKASVTERGIRFKGMYLQESIGFNLRPLHHILLMRFFAGTVENFFNSKGRTSIWERPLAVCE